MTGSSLDRSRHDPERCSYGALDPETERLVRERFAAAFEAEVDRLGVTDEGVGLRSVESSIERNSDGHRWLRFLATDGASWYLGWDGDPAEAISIAEEFGVAITGSLEDGRSDWV